MDDVSLHENMTQPESNGETLAAPPDPQADPEAAPSSDTPHRTQIAALEAQLATLRAELERERSSRERLGRELQAAVVSYRDAVLAAAPDLPDEMVTGGTVVEVEESAHRARRLVEQVRATVEAQVQQTRIPAGAPARMAPDLDGLSAREKITRGLQDRR